MIFISHVDFAELKLEGKKLMSNWRSESLQKSQERGNRVGGANSLSEKLLK